MCCTAASTKIFAMAAITNAAAHSVLADSLNEYDGLEICKEQEEQGKANVAVLGTKLGECAHAAVVLLSDGDDQRGTRDEEGLGSHAVLMRGSERYRFKWGRKPVMELGFTTPSPEERGKLALAVIGAIGLGHSDLCAYSFECL